MGHRSPAPVRLGIDAHGDHTHCAFVAERRSIGVGNVREIEAVDAVPVRSPACKFAPTIRLQDVHALMVPQPGFAAADDVAAVHGNDQSDSTVQAVFDFDSVEISLFRLGVHLADPLAHKHRIGRQCPAVVCCDPHFHAVSDTPCPDVCRTQKDGQKKKCDGFHDRFLLVRLILSY